MGAGDTWADTRRMSDLVEINDAGYEDARMVTASNPVESERTVELLQRWLPPASAPVLDIGGGPGGYRRGGGDVALGQACRQSVKA